MANKTRNDRGQFVKGVRYSPKTEFKKGQHWRPRKPYWNKNWLYREYVTHKHTSSEIAAQFGITESAILFWLNKHGIKTRSMSEIRSIKKWSSPGNQNGMFGRTGNKNPRWMGGVSPERQSFYSSSEWGLVVKRVWKRDKGICQRCGATDRAIHIHHIVSFAVRELRTSLDNLVSLCVPCHRFVHSRKNVNKEFIRKEV